VSSTSTSEERIVLSLLVNNAMAGICTDDQVQRCLFCSWEHEDYETVPIHDPLCPILRGRRVLEMPI